ncbi:ESC4 [Candida margitis]|uniref:ESC4 n=1 Tax=Candida margitis TaxID=1775924 RepID=UPI0022279FAE|nr:ESC4 [Candida margitis]KAI5953810.1 ESC4 [Candida margitis]
MLQGYTFLIIKSIDLDEQEAARLETLLYKHDATKVYFKDEFDNSKNYFDPPSITHIVTKSIDFIEYPQAQKSMIPIVTPEWVHDSVERSAVLPIKSYNPNPDYFFRNCFVCCTDNLPQGDKELIYAAVQAFGGNYLDVLSKYTTHLIAMDMTNEKSIIASSLIHDPNCRDPVMDIKIVLPHWIDHCLIMGKKLDEQKYLLPNSDSFDMNASDQAGELLMEIKNDFSAPILDDSVPKSSEDDSFKGIDYFRGKRFYVCSDFNLSQRLSNSIKGLIEKLGGVIVSSYSDDFDIYLGKYRHGEAYQKSRANKRIIVANLQWLYSIIVTKKWVLPLNSNILYYPIPPTHIDEFKSLRISISNYSGDSRAYLSKLVTLMGATFTKTLTRDNDYLVCAKPEGKKYDAAMSKWIGMDGKPEVKVVNHMWLEDCFIQWLKLDHTDAKYTNFGNSDLGMEPLVGGAHLDDDHLDELGDRNANVTGNVDDSMSEDESTQSRKIAPPAPLTNTKREVTSSGDLAKFAEKPVQEKEVEEDVMSINSPPNGTPNKSDISAEINSPKTPNDFGESSVYNARYGGRSAAKKAAAKLHDNMSDLNAYLQMSKSSKKMKSYMNELEQSANAKRKHLQENNDPKTDEDTGSLDFKRQRTDECSIIAIMTGCEQTIELAKNDYTKLQSVGIKVIANLSKHTPNTLIAPKILRTEKFLRSLSKVDRIIHPSYIVDVLANAENNENVLNLYRIDDYALDKVNPSANADLGVKSLHALLSKKGTRGSLLQGVSLNLSKNLNGGIEVISRILQDHGLHKYEEVRTTLTKKTPICSCSFNGKEVSILIANKNKDAKLIASFKKSYINGVVLSWDWCVSSIFAMELQKFDDFKL